MHQSQMPDGSTDQSRCPQTLRPEALEGYEELGPGACVDAQGNVFGRWELRWTPLGICGR